MTLKIGTTGAALAALLISITGCDSTERSSATTRQETTPVIEEEPAMTEHAVLYEVEGSTDYAAVTMETPTGTVQVNPDVPMKRKDSEEPGVLYVFEPGDFVYISAQNQRGHGTITCRITVDGEVISENTSSGGYSIASCDGVAE